MRSFVTIGREALDSIIQERDALKAERDALREAIAEWTTECAALREANAQVHLMGAQTEIEHKAIRKSGDEFKRGFQAGINAARAALK